MIKRAEAERLLNRFYSDWCTENVEPKILKQIKLNLDKCYILFPDYVNKDKLKAELEFNGYTILDIDPDSNLPVPYNNILISWLQ